MQPWDENESEQSEDFEWYTEMDREFQFEKEFFDEDQWNDFKQRICVECGAPDRMDNEGNCKNCRILKEEKEEGIIKRDQYLRRITYNKKCIECNRNYNELLDGKCGNCRNKEQGIKLVRIEEKLYKEYLANAGWSMEKGIKIPLELNYNEEQILKYRIQTRSEIWGQCKHGLRQQIFRICDLFIIQYFIDKGFEQEINRELFYFLR